MVAVSLHGADPGGVNNGTEITDLVWPSNVRKGDAAVVWWTLISTATPTDPAGFTLKQSHTGDSGSIMCRFYRRVCDGTESGAISLVADITNRMSAVLSVYRGAHDVEPIDTWAVRDEGTSGTTHACPQVTLGFGGCVIVTAAAERSSTGTNNWTAPSGYTERADSTTLATGTGGTITGVADDGLAVVRSAGAAVTPPDWTSGNAFSSANVTTWTVSVRPMVTGVPPQVVAQAVARAATW